MEAFGTCQDYINMIQFLKQLHDTVTMFSWHNFFKCSPLVVSSDRCDCLKTVIIFDREVLPPWCIFSMFLGILALLSNFNCDLKKQSSWSKKSPQFFSKSVLSKSFSSYLQTIRFKFCMCYFFVMVVYL